MDLFGLGHSRHGAYGIHAARFDLVGARSAYDQVDGFVGSDLLSVDDNIVQSRVVYSAVKGIPEK